MAEGVLADSAGSSPAGAYPLVAATALDLPADGAPHLGPRSEAEEISDEAGAVYRSQTSTGTRPKLNILKQGPQPFFRSI